MECIDPGDDRIDAFTLAGTWESGSLEWASGKSASFMAVMRALFDRYLLFIDQEGPIALR